MNRLSRSNITTDILLAILAGIATAMFSLRFSLIAMVVFVTACVRLRRFRFLQKKPRLATCGLITSSLVFVVVLTGAALYRPAKVTEQLLSREITLPSTRLTLAELATLTTCDRGALSANVMFSFAVADKDLTIEWPQRKLTLRDFVDAIETQTVLRHRFLHCGNGYTIFNGGDCCFGLIVRDPGLTTTPYSPECIGVE